MTGDEFDMPGDNPGEIDVMTSQPGDAAVAAQQQGGVEKIISDSEITDQARKQAELEEIRRQQAEALRKVEKKEREYFQNGKRTMGDIWDDAMKQVISAYSVSEDVDLRDVGKFKKTVYSVARLFGVDMYNREALAKIRGSEKLADQLKYKLDVMYSQLKRKKGRTKGVDVQLREEELLATSVANALIKSKKAEKEYAMQIQSKYDEITDLQSQAQNTPSVDYADDIELISGKIDKTEVERKGMEEDVVRLNQQLHEYGLVVKTSRAISKTMNHIYSKGLKAHRLLASEIGYGKIFLKQSKRIRQTVIPVMDDIGIAVGEIGKARQAGQILGEAINKATSEITEELDQYDLEAEEKSYLRDMQKQINEDNQKENKSTERLLAEFATIPYK